MTSKTKKTDNFSRLAHCSPPPRPPWLCCLPDSSVHLIVLPVLPLRDSLLSPPASASSLMYASPLSLRTLHLSLSTVSHRLSLVLHSRPSWPCLVQIPTRTSFSKTHSSSADCVGRHRSYFWLFLSRHFHCASNCCPQCALSFSMLLRGRR